MKSQIYKTKKTNSYISKNESSVVVWVTEQLLPLAKRWEYEFGFFKTLIANLWEATAKLT